MDVTVLLPGAVSYRMCYLSTLEYLSLFGASIKFANWTLFSCYCNYYYVPFPDSYPMVGREDMVGTGETSFFFLPDLLVW